MGRLNCSLYLPFDLAGSTADLYVIEIGIDVLEVCFAVLEVDFKI